MSAAMAWLYAAFYVVVAIAACFLVLAALVIAWDVLIIVGDPTSSWGAGGAYQIFWFCVDFVKWAAIIGGSFLAFFGGTRIIGVILQDAYEGTPADQKRHVAYMVGAIAFLLPSAILRAFLDNAEEHFGTLQLIDPILERIL